MTNGSFVIDKRPHIFHLISRKSVVCHTGVMPFVMPFWRLIMDCTARLYGLLSGDEHVTRSALLRGLRTVSAANLDRALERIRSSGKLDEKIVRPVRGRPHNVYRLRTAPNADQPPGREMALRDDLWAEQRRAEAQVIGWINTLGATARDVRAPNRQRAGARCATDVLVALYRAPHRYGRRTPARDVRIVLDHEYEEGIWRLALRQLDQIGAVRLSERRDAPEMTSMSLTNPPPMAMKG